MRIPASTPAEPAEPVAAIEPTAPRVREASPAPLDEIDESWPPAPRNPYRLALLLAGVGMLLGAGILIWYSVRTANTSSGVPDVGEQTLSFVEYLVPPALLLGGLISLVAWLVLGAVAARDVRRS
jgi:hypothetical protein